MDGLIKLRCELHRHPELPGSEQETAERIVEFFDPLQPDAVIRNLGGHGLAFVFSGTLPGPTVLLRCELDALPVDETSETPHHSVRPGVSHACGHDGHMAVIAGVGVELSKRRPTKGRVVLLYQPAEETGAGAAAVIRDSRFLQIKPDYAFAFHNLPGFPFGQIILRSGTFNCASRGITVELSGITAHAAQPEQGVAPTTAMCRVVHELEDLAATLDFDSEYSFATVVGAQLGEKAFGTAPGFARIWATLRSKTDSDMNRMANRVEDMVSQIAEAEGLGRSIVSEDVFLTTVNSDEAVRVILEAVQQNSVRMLDRPFRWSEDFGRFTSIADGALFGIGAGECPKLHSPTYDFPDELIPGVVEIFGRILDVILK
ncbi:MAG: amidohydrolase [bacterium]|nr:amidohydrolase [bacterium]